jgi:MFS family permease
MFGCSTNIVTASIARFLMGASGAFSFICALYIIIRWFPTWHFALFAGIAQMLACISAFLSQTSLPWLISNFNWRYSMIILSFAGLALTVLIWLLIRDHPKEFIVPKTKTTNMLVSLNPILRNPQIWYIMLYAFAIWAPISAFSALWGVPFIKTNCHIHNFEAAKIVSYSWIGIAIGSPIIGWVSDKIQRRCLPLAIAALIGCVAILCVIFIPHLSIWSLKLLIFCFGLSAAGQTLIFAVVKDIIPTNIAGTANGLTNMAVVLGGALFQPVIGELLDINWQGMLEHGVRTYDLHSYHIAFIALPICYLLAFVTSAFFIRETHCKITYDQTRF